MQIRPDSALAVVQRSGQVHNEAGIYQPTWSKVGGKVNPIPLSAKTGESDQRSTRKGIHNRLTWDETALGRPLRQHKTKHAQKISPLTFRLLEALDSSNWQIRISRGKK